jgi:tricarballylate dehydrogenase
MRWPADRVPRQGASVASGGFESNLEWLKVGAPPPTTSSSAARPQQGKILKLLLNSGAESVGDPTQCHAVAIDGPWFDGGIVTRLTAAPRHRRQQARRALLRRGEDLWPKRYAIWGRLVAQQPDQIAYSIIDSKVLGRFIPSVFPPIKAGSIAELATAFALPPEKLDTTVREFNQSVTPGHFDHNLLDDCRTSGLTPPKSHWAQAIDRPPFLGYPLRPGITFTYLSVAVNENAQVKMDGAASPNLFAAGEIMAGNVVGKGYSARHDHRRSLRPHRGGARAAQPNPTAEGERS